MEKATCRGEIGWLTRIETGMLDDAQFITLDRHPVVVKFRFFL